MVNVLQRFILPSGDTCSELGLYAHVDSNVHYLFGTRTLEFFRGGTAIFDTYFNSFSTGKWKRHTVVDSLGFRVQLRGRFLLRFAENRPHAASRFVHERILDSADLVWHEMHLPFDSLGNGTLFAQATCLSPAGSLTQACFVTTTRPQRVPRVGIVITTFNRPGYVRANLARLREAIAAEPALKRALHVVVVDNASNLELPTDDFVTYIPNHNLGGAGGFSRGLLHLRDQGGFTHVLFMDDDVSFETESIRRAAMFTAFARDEETCLSGAMFVESVPHVQYESGAALSFEDSGALLHRYGCDMNMHDWQQVMMNDAVDRPIRYGAWWFFLFPIGLSGTDLAFPLFIRGDDMLFGYRYAKRIVTMNGLCVWHTPFDYKDSATTLYYNQRNSEVVRAVAGPTDLGTWPALAHFVRATLRESLTYRYGTANYRIRAMRDFMKGPAFWEETDISALHDELRAGDTEAPKPLDLDSGAADVDSPGSIHAGGPLRRLLQLLTLNGHLLPYAIIDRTGNGAPRTVPLQWRGYGAVFGQKRVRYLHAATGEGFVARHSKRRFFRNLRDLASVTVDVARNYGRVRDAYRRAYPELVSPQSWIRRFRRADPDHDTETAPRSRASA